MSQNEHPGIDPAVRDRILHKLTPFTAALTAAVESGAPAVLDRLVEATDELMRALAGARLAAERRKTTN